MLWAMPDLHLERAVVKGSGEGLGVRTGAMNGWGALRDCRRGAGLSSQRCDGSTMLSAVAESTVGTRMVSLQWSSVC